MKLKKIKTFIVGNTPPHLGGRYWIFIKLITDKDIVGYGEIYSSGYTQRPDISLMGLINGIEMAEI